MVNANADDILNKIEAGEYDTATTTVPPQFLKKYSADKSLAPYFHQNSGDRTWYLTMNLTQPPFDDLHVRKAMNWIMDKDALRPGVGRPDRSAAIANHIVPDPLLNNLLADYAPYRTPGDKGSLAKAKAAMKGSKYDTDKNGTCSAGVQERAPDRRHPRGRHEMLPVIEASARRSASRFAVRDGRGRVPDDPDTRRRTSRSPSGPAGVRTTPTRTRSSARCSTAARSSRPGNTNYSLVGITPAIAQDGRRHGQRRQTCRASTQTSRPVRRPGRCRAHACYASLDKKLMTKVVPWVPYLWSNA